MTALMTLLTPIPGEEGYVFAIVADDDSARYVFADGADSDDLGLDSDRITRLADWADSKPNSAEEWTAVAAQSLGNPVAAEPREFDSVEQAVEKALELITAYPTPQANPSRAPGQYPEGAPEPPMSRDDRMAFERDALDEWAQQYPEAAAGDVHDPEADLALAHLMTPPVDPTKPHRWLPIATTEEDCGFCEKSADNVIHTATADTIT